METVISPEPILVNLKELTKRLKLEYNECGQR